MMTDIFIFMELVNCSSVLEPCHTGSTPNGYGVVVCGSITTPVLDASGHRENGNDGSATINNPTPMRP